MSTPARSNVVANVARNLCVYPHDIFVDKTDYTTLWGAGAFDEDEEPEVQPLIETVVTAPAIEGTDYTTGMVDLLPETSNTRIDPASQPTDVLDMPPDCLYGWLGEKAKELQAPLGWAYVSLMTIFAAQGINEGAAESEIRPTLYTCLVGRPGDGKSRVMNRARQSLVVEPFIYKNHVPASDRGIFSMFIPRKGQPEPRSR